MAQSRHDRPSVRTFADHEVIVPTNRLAGAIRKNSDPADDPLARAEDAIAQLSSEFGDWMQAECDRLDAARQAIMARGLGKLTRDELFLAAHDIKGDAATFGYPLAAPAAESLCKILEHTPQKDRIPVSLIDQHVDAVRAIVREYARPDIDEIATALNGRLRSVTYDFLLRENRHRPGYLDSVFSPPLVPSDIA